MSDIPAFWQSKSLSEMSEEEWELICDGCGKCCLVKLQDEEDATVYFTDVACRLLDLATCRCTDYTNRSSRVPECIDLSSGRLSPERLDELWQMPPSCSYRRMHEGRGLAQWHHLVSGDRNQVHHAQASVRGRVVVETELASDAELEDRLVDWPLKE